MKTGPKAASPAAGLKFLFPPIFSFLLTCGILFLARSKAPFEILLADRLLPGAGLAEIFVLGLYAVFLTVKMTGTPDTSKTRRIIWTAFSVVFFLQFILGVSLVPRLLMTGRLHIPVPAVVIAGPIFRGAQFFMPILFLSTMVLTGPAWCSYLCYFGCWDGLAASARKNSAPLSRAWTFVRIALFAAVPAAAIILRTAGVSGMIAGYIAVGFGIAGIGTMIFLTGRKGTMVHCTSICPLGLAGNILGKISPFRIRIGDSCTECGRCTRTCRYDALRDGHLRKRKPGYTCTLCGDCLPACKEGFLSYSFFGLSPLRARTLFLTIVVSLHAVFIGVARI